MKIVFDGGWGGSLGELNLPFSHGHFVHVCLSSSAVSRASLSEKRTTNLYCACALRGILLNILPTLFTLLWINPLLPYHLAFVVSSVGRMTAPVKRWFRVRTPGKDEFLVNYEVSVEANCFPL